MCESLIDVFLMSLYYQILMIYGEAMQKNCELKNFDVDEFWGSSITFFGCTDLSLCPYEYISIYIYIDI